MLDVVHCKMDDINSKRRVDTLLLAVFYYNEAFLLFFLFCCSVTQKIKRI